MRRAAWFVAVAALTLAVASPMAAQDRRGRLGGSSRRGDGPADSDYRQRYGVLAESNIFLRDRSRRPFATEPTSRPAPPPAAPEKSFVLTGIVLEDGAYRAYVEDAGRRSILRLSIGDAVARGHVVGIDIDAIAYEYDGQVSWVMLGQDLSGSQVATWSSTTLAGSAGPTTGPADTGPTLDPNDPNLTLEQRMRLRRMQEMNR